MSTPVSDSESVPESPAPDPIYGAPTEHTTDRRRWWMLGFLSIAMTLVVIDATVLNVAVPQIASDIGARPSDVQWFNAMYSLVFASLLITMGRAGDQIGYRRLFITGVLTFVLASMIAATADSSSVLIAGRALQGVGGAMLVPATLSMVNERFVGKDRGAAFAVWGVVIGVVAALGPLLGGFVIEQFSWRWAFGINLPIAAVAIVGVLLTSDRRPRSTTKVRYDLFGALLSALAVGSIVFALIQGFEYGWWRPRGDVKLGPLSWPITAFSPVVVAAILGIVATLLFLRLESRRSQRGDPVVLDLTLFKIPTFAAGTLTGLVIMFGEFGMILTLPLFLQNVLGYNALQAGATVAAITVGGLTGAISSARFVALRGPATVVRWGLVAQVIAMIGIAFHYGADTSGIGFIPWLLLFGVGVGLTNAQLLNLVLADVPVAQSGQASGTQSTSRQIGIAMGVAVLGAVLWGSLGGELNGRVDDAPAVRDAITATSGASINSPDVAAPDRIDALFDAETQQFAKEAFSDSVAKATLVGAGFVALSLFSMARIRRADEADLAEKPST